MESFHVKTVIGKGNTGSLYNLKINIVPQCPTVLGRPKSLSYLHRSTLGRAQNHPYFGLLGPEENQSPRFLDIKLDITTGQIPQGQGLRGPPGHFPCERTRKKARRYKSLISVHSYQRAAFMPGWGKWGSGGKISNSSHQIQC